MCEELNGRSTFTCLSPPIESEVDSYVTLYLEFKSLLGHSLLCVAVKRMRGKYGFFYLPSLL